MDNTLFGASPIEENPLIVASVSGQVEFAGEILRLRPESAYELDKDGFSPLHTAAATGQLEIVRAILGIDTKLCRFKGRDGRTPFHVAAIKGKVDVLREMVLCCVECVEDGTVQGETALHLALKNNRFEAATVMVTLIRDVKRDDVLSKKDEQGNTLLHLATWRKQRQVIELLLQTKPAESRPFEVNAVNKTGLTALDLLLLFPSEAGDREIYEILRDAGARRGKDFITVTTTTTTPTPTSQDPTADEPNRDNLVEYFTFKRWRDSPSEARSALLVVASLVTTATFQAGLSPPGGTWQDSNSPAGQKAHKAGQSIMGTFDGVSFTLFVLFNSIGFSVSLSMINILTCGFPLQFELQVCMVAMYFSYNTAMNTIAPDHVKLYCILITSILSAATPALTKLLERPVYKLVQFLRLLLHRIF